MNIADSGHYKTKAGSLVKTQKMLGMVIFK